MADLDFYKFSYSDAKDKKNVIHEFFIQQAPRTEALIKGPQQTIDILARSQPGTIFNSHSSKLICYAGKANILKRSIILPNNYELFNAPWLADGTHSYCNHAVRSDWKRWFPAGHNQVLSEHGEPLNAIPLKSFDNIKFISDNRLKIVIKNHIDSDNYWHWTFEWLPRLMMARTLLSERFSLESVLFIVIGSPLKRFQKDWIDLVLGTSIDISYYNQPILCNRLFWATPAFPLHHSSDLLMRLSQSVLRSIQFQDIGLKSNVVHKRLYLQRGQARNGRNIVNEDKVLSLLSLYGFISLSMDKLSIYEQAHIFSNADIIIGPHGSAFVNMLFCKKRCQIIEFFGPGYLSAHDYSLAFMLELNWMFIQGTSDNANSTFTSDYLVDIQILKDRLDSCSAIRQDFS